MKNGVTSGMAVLASGVGMLLASCQQTPSLDRKTYPDAVVHISQVDPAYRPYFARQNGANYSREEQMAAFTKAKQTASGPMPDYVAAKPKPSVKGKGKVKGKTTTKGKTSAKGKTTTKGKSLIKGKTTAKGSSKPAAKKPAAKTPAKAPAKKPAAKKPAAKKPAAKKR